MKILTIPTTSGDCSGDASGAFSSNGNSLMIGSVFSSFLWSCKAWLPFVVPVNNGVLIRYATLKMIATNSDSEDVNVKWGCEAADNPSAPASWAQLNGRTLSTAYTSGAVAAWTAASEYQVDVTTAVQEVLSRDGWVYGNTIAVLIHDNGSAAALGRRFASVENSTYIEAILEIGIVSGEPAAISPYFRI